MRSKPIGLCHEEIITMYLSGMTETEIARKLGCTPQNIYSHIKRHAKVQKNMEYDTFIKNYRSKKHEEAQASQDPAHNFSDIVHTQFSKIAGKQGPVEFELIDGMVHFRIGADQMQNMIAAVQAIVDIGETLMKLTGAGEMGKRK